MKRWIVVGLTEDGEEIKRVTVDESKLEKAITVFSDFSDWIQVVDPDAKVPTRTAWSR